MSILHFTPVSSDRAETKSGPTNSLSKCVSNFEASDSSLLFSAPLGHLLIISSHTHFITSYSVTKMSVCVCSVLDHQVQIYLQAQVQVPGQVPGLLQVCSRSGPRAGPRSAPGQVLGLLQVRCPAVPAQRPGIGLFIQFGIPHTSKFS